MHAGLSTLHFEFPTFAAPIPREGVEICLAFWEGAPDPSRLADLLGDRPDLREEARALSLRIADPSRLSESLLARIAREELFRRTGGPARRAGSSFSHTRRGGTLVAAAVVADGAVGIDVEADKSLESRPQLLERILTGAERESISGLAPAERLARALELWCAKESLAKALGTGLVAPLEQYEAFFGSEGQINFRQFPGWVAGVIRPPGLVLALCCSGAPQTMHR